jgi:hypothetical protein
VAKHNKKKGKECWMCESCSVLPPFVCFTFDVPIEEDEMEQAEQCSMFDATVDISQPLVEE